MSKRVKIEGDRHIKSEHDDVRDPRVKHEYHIKREVKHEYDEDENCDGTVRFNDVDDVIVEKEKPNFEPSGLLAAVTNQKNGIALKYMKPPESRFPTQGWKLYVFKPKEDDPNEVSIIKTIPIDKKEHYLIGKEQRVADIDIYHPTISKQHAVIQHKVNNKTDDVSPYLMDLESTNGTFLNDERIESCRYYELREKDVIKFGRSTREYIILHDGSIEDTK